MLKLLFKFFKILKPAKRNKEWHKTSVKSLVAGEKYYDVPDLDMGQEMTFVKRDKRTCYFHGTEGFYKKGKSGYLEFRGIVVFFKKL